MSNPKQTSCFLELVFINKNIEDIIYLLIH